MTSVINIDDLIDEKPLLVIKSKGVEHAARPTSVGDFLANLKAVEGLKVNSSQSEEIEVAMGVILRSFPTLTREEVEGWRIDAIQKIFQAVQSVDGNNAEGQDEAGNQSAS